MMRFTRGAVAVKIVALLQMSSLLSQTLLFRVDLVTVVEGLASSSSSSSSASASSSQNRLSKRGRPPRIRLPRKTSSSTHDEKNDDDSMLLIHKHNNDNAKALSREDEGQPFPPSASLPPLSTQQQQQQQQDDDAANWKTDRLFSNLPDLQPKTLRALTEGMGLQTMTQVQAETYGPILEGKSVMARSRTGSGKTVAFLLPSIERLLQDQQQDLQLYRPGRSIGMIVLSPTRELAIQIADQAEALLHYHGSSHRNKGCSVACLYGGVKIQRDIHLLSGSSGGGGRGAAPSLPMILVATPGRLLEHLERNTPLGRNNKFADVVQETKIVVLDETDRLMDNCHRKETTKILSFLARSEKRQTLLFSATFPRTIRRLLQQTVLKGKHDVFDVDCIDVDHDGLEKVAQHSFSKKGQDSDTVNAINQRTQQSYVLLDHMGQYISILLAIIRREQHSRPDDFKILVFFPAGRLVRFFYHFFTLGNINLGGVRTAANNNSNIDNDLVWEIHSRMSQSSRTRASISFRKARRGILFSSDVSARGLDYPDVSLVVQMGSPLNPQDYIHRLGRSGRAGKEGRGLLVLLPFEKATDTDAMGGGSLEEDHELMSWLDACYDDDDDDNNNNNRMSESAFSLADDRNDMESTRLKIRSGHAVLTPSAEAGYKSFIGHYATNKKSQTPKSTIKAKLRPEEILAHADNFASAMGINPPDLDETTSTKIGLK